ncbi:MAG: phage holin family protein [Verrucomicrobiota bacterium]|jgi:uncharacterized membrane protein YqjE
MEEPGESTPGVFASLGRLLKTAVAIAHNRFELFLVELREERWRFFNALLLAGVVLILALMTLMAATIALVVVCVKAGRLDLVVALVLLYLAATILCFWRLRVRLKNWAAFSATLTELKKDKACLDDRN